MTWMYIFRCPICCNPYEIINASDDPKPDPPRCYDGGITVLESMWLLITPEALP